MKKIYETWEIIKMLGENHDLKFEPIAIPIEAINEGLFVYADKKGVIRWGGKNQDNQLFVIVGRNADRWTLVREPLTFQEAIKAFKDGHKIKSKFQDEDGEEDSYEYDPIGDNNPAFLLLEIAGAWYIND